MFPIMPNIVQHILRSAIDDTRLRRQRYRYRRRPACLLGVSDAGKMPAVQGIPSPICPIERRSGYKSVPPRLSPRCNRSIGAIRPFRRLAIFAAMTLGVISLSACTSPFGDHSGTPSGSGFADSVLAHDLSDGRLLTHASMLPVDRGVHERLAAESTSAH